MAPSCQFLAKDDKILADTRTLRLRDLFPKNCSQKVKAAIEILDAVGWSRILIGKQKIGLTFNSDKLGGNDFTKGDPY